MKSIIIFLCFIFINFSNVVLSQCIADIRPVPNLYGCIETISPVVWTDVTLVNVSGNTIARPSGNGWNSGAASVHSVVDNMFMTTVVAETNRHRSIGLNSNNPNANYNNIDYSFMLRNNGTLRIYENGAYRGAFGNYATGDTLKIAIENNVAKYYNNGVLLYTSTISPSLPLIVDASIYSNSGTLENVNIGTYVSTDFTCQTSNMGGSLTYQWKLNGANVGTNSNTYSNTSILSTDNLTCEVTPTASFCGGSVVSSNVLNFRNKIPENITAYVKPDYGVLGCVMAEALVSWTNAINTTLSSGNNLSRTSGNGWGSSGASGTNAVIDNMYVKTIINETNRRRAFGLSDLDVNTHYNTIDYAFYLNSNGQLRVYESGSYRGAFGNYNAGDTLKVSVENGTVNYYNNGQLLYTSTIAPSFPLIVG